MSPSSSGSSGGHFHTTRWSVVMSARRGATPDSRQALSTLAESYWYPLYAYLRRRGVQAEEACDLTQGFFARVLEQDGFAGVTPEKGRFRSYLLGALKHFLANEAERARALKRGGGATIISMDAIDADRRYAMEPAHDSTPDRLFEQSWARSVLDRTMVKLREEYEKNGRKELFDTLQPFMAGGDRLNTYSELAEQLSMTEGAIKVAVHRLRQRFGSHLRKEIADTVADASEVESEVQQLFDALRP